MNIQVRQPAYSVCRTASPPSGSAYNRDGLMGMLSSFFRVVAAGAQPAGFPLQQPRRQEVLLCLASILKRDFDQALSHADELHKRHADSPLGKFLTAAALQVWMPKYRAVKDTDVARESRAIGSRRWGDEDNYPVRPIGCAGVAWLARANIFQTIAMRAIVCSLAHRRNPMSRLLRFIRPGT